MLRTLPVLLCAPGLLEVSASDGAPPTERSAATCPVPVTNQVKAVRAFSEIDMSVEVSATHEETRKEKNGKAQEWMTITVLEAGPGQ
jgi:hypothetical protein